MGWIGEGKEIFILRNFFLTLASPFPFHSHDGDLLLCLEAFFWFHDDISVMHATTHESATAVIQVYKNETEKEAFVGCAILYVCTYCSRDTAETIQKKVREEEEEKVSPHQRVESNKTVN